MVYERADDALAEAGLTVADIDIVLATHLHFDHAGGFTVRDAGNRIRPRFPRARYVVRRGEWDDARHDELQERLSAEVKAAQREAEKQGVLVASTIDFPQDVSTMFEDVFKEMPWHLREQKEMMIAELEAKRK